MRHPLIYFPPYMGKFVDGGTMANNPTQDAMADILIQEEKEKSGHKLAMVVSIGTGICGGMTSTPTQEAESLSGKPASGSTRDEDPEQ